VFQCARIRRREQTKVKTKNRQHAHTSLTCECVGAWYVITARVAASTSPWLMRAYVSSSNDGDGALSGGTLSCIKV
jgi:hypothetical protein